MEKFSYFNIMPAKQIIQVILFAMATFICPSCENSDGLVEESGSGVEIYLLNDYRTVTGEGQIIDESSIRTKPAPLVYYSEIISYDDETHTIEFTRSAADKIFGLNAPTNGKAFAIMVNRELIYTGYFWPLYSSATCNWPTIDPIPLHSGVKAKINLGYPGDFGAEKITDRRNDSRIIAILSRDGKLR